MLRNLLTTPRLITLSFLAVIAVGALLLMLPISRQPGVAPISVCDAIFTATSATCVTGLSVRDTGKDFSAIGQLIILLLCQVGGIGIITISNHILFMAGRRLALGDRETIEASHGALPQVHPIILVRQVIRYSLTIEAIGAVILTARFAMDFPLREALWHGIFHAVSAFCNAGFSLFSDNLMGYHDDVVVNITVMALITLGGLGFVVFSDLQSRVGAWLRRENLRLSLHTRTVLRFSFALVVLGAVMLLMMEANNPVREDTPFGTLLLEMFFVSVTARTAGFNTIDMATMTDSSLMFVMLLMIVGASPGSTGGGIKTTTLAVFYAMIRSRLRARPTVELFDRTLPMDVLGKGVATVFGFLATVFVAVVLLGWTELGNAPSTESKGQFLIQLFEVISATGTVGLSLGGTADYSPAGKMILSGCMFFGRLGPLLLGASLVGRQRSVPYQLPNESLMIG